MKAGYVLLLAAVMISPLAFAEADPSLTGPALGTELNQKVGPPGEGVYAITENGAHHRRWSKRSSILMAGGSNQTIQTITNSYVELATGANRLDANNRWVPAEANFEIINGAAVARNTAHRVILTSPTDAIPVDVLMPDGQRLSSRVLGISYYSAASAKSVLLAEVKPAQGKFIPPNCVVYEDCFDGGFRATLRYVLTLAGLEQDVIFLAQPPTPEEAGMQLGDESIRLELITEFLKAPEPTIKELPLHLEADPRRRAEMAEPDFIDQTLWFTSMVIGHGTAFDLDPSGQAQPGKSQIDVAKHWQKIGERTVMFEAVRMDQVSEHLANLPPRLQAATTNPIKSTVVASRDKLLPTRKTAPSSNPVLEAKYSAPNKGFALDYSVLSHQSDFTLQASETYWVTNSVNLSGTTLIEGGSVIKLGTDPNATINIYGPVDCRTGPYRPCVFTPQADDSIGQVVGTDELDLGRIYGFYALRFKTGQSANLKYLNIRHLYGGIDFGVGGTHTLSHSQIGNVQYAISTANNADVSLRNVLVHDVSDSVFAQFTGTIRGEHLTIHAADHLSRPQYLGPMPVYLTNSLVIGVVNLDTTTSSAGCYATTVNESGIFQKSGYGFYYLAAESIHRNTGITGINSGLLAALKTKTTYPPIELSNNIAVDTTLLPRAQRDTDIPDKGFHFDPLDYVLTNVTVASATLVLTNGVAVGLNPGPVLGYGIRLSNGAKVISEGKPLALNTVCRVNAVQEQITLQSSDWGPTFVDASSTSPLSEVHLRFTHLPMMSDGCHFFGGANLQTFTMSNCQLYGGKLNHVQSGAAGRTLCLTNNLFYRLAWEFGTGTDPVMMTLYNNTFVSGAGLFLPASGTSWLIRDNLFDGTALSQGNPVSADYNAYISGGSQLTPIGTHNRYAASFPYDSDAWGINAFYQSTGSPVIDAGSRSAALAGLYHYTVTANQVKEESTQVDIGFHYVALDTHGNSDDYDGDGLPDCWEDRNGNGTADAGESNWTTYDSPNWLTGTPGLQIFAPSKP